MVTLIFEFDPDKMTLNLVPEIGLPTRNTYEIWKLYHLPFQSYGNVSF